MTEHEWLACNYWPDWFGYIEQKASGRKLRLFAVACCRTAWWLLKEESQKAVELAEKYADGLATSDELHAARESFRATEADSVVEVIVGIRYRHDIGGSAADENVLWAAKSAMRQSADLVAWSKLRETGRDFSASDFGSALTAEMATRHFLLHDIVGATPFGRVTFDCSYETPNVVAVAKAIYDTHTFTNMPILAKALEEAGCTNAEILNHCRSKKTHVRGCWLVDLILGKE